MTVFFVKIIVFKIIVFLFLFTIFYYVHDMVIVPEVKRIYPNDTKYWGFSPLRNIERYIHICRWKNKNPIAGYALIGIEILSFLVLVIPVRY